MEYFFKKYLLPNFLIVQMIFSPLQGFSYDSRDEEQARKNSTRYNWKTGESRTGFYFTVEDITFLSDLYRLFESRLLTNREYLKSILWCLDNPQEAIKNQETLIKCHAYLSNKQAEINALFSEMRVNLALSKMFYFQNELLNLDPTRNPHNTNPAASGVDPEFENPFNLDDEYYYLGKIKFLFYEENGVTKHRIYKTITPIHDYGISLFTNHNSELAPLQPLSQEEIKLATNKLKELEKIAFLCAYGEISTCPLPPPEHMKQFLELKTSYMKDKKWTPHQKRLLMAKISNQIKYAVKNYVYSFFQEHKKIFKKNYEDILTQLPIIGFISNPLNGNPWKSRELRDAIAHVLKNNLSVASDFQNYFNREDFGQLLILASYAPVVEALIKIKTAGLNESEVTKLEDSTRKTHNKLLTEMRTRKMTRDTIFYIGLGLVTLPCAAIGNVLGAASCGVGLGAMTSYGQFRYSRFFYEKDFGDFFSTDTNQFAIAEISELENRQIEMIFAYIFLGVVPGSLSFLKVLKPETRKAIEALRVSVLRSAQKGRL